MGCLVGRLCQPLLAILPNGTFLNKLSHAPRSTAFPNQRRCERGVSQRSRTGGDRIIEYIPAIHTRRCLCLVYARRCTAYRGRFRESEHALLRALELAREDKRIAVCSCLAQLYNDTGRYAEAEQYYLQLVVHEDWQEQGWVWILRGGNLALLGNYELAEFCHRQATTLVDVHADEAWLNLGLVLRAQGKYSAAKRALKKSLRLDSCCADTRKALKSLRGIEEALETVKQLENLD